MNHQVQQPLRHHLHLAACHMCQVVAVAMAAAAQWEEATVAMVVVVAGALDPPI